MPFLRAVAQSRLLHFLLIGSAVFALAPGQSTSGRISLSDQTLSALRLGRAQREGVTTLPAAEVREVQEEAVEDELLYREAIRLGLDRGDPLIRRHLIQKVLMLAEDLGGGSRAPSSYELRAYYEAHLAQWQRPPSIHFIHVFGREAERLRALRPEVERWPGSAPPPFGDPFPVVRDVRGTEAEVAASLGADFAASVFALPEGAWSELLPSRLGWHLVKILERAPAQQATLKEVAPRVALELERERRRKAIEQFLQRSSERYRIDVNGQPVTALHGTGRVGARGDSSAED
jgi:peptidyl-prolyl cis-trans isomerase C